MVFQFFQICFWGEKRQSSGSNKFSDLDDAGNKGISENYWWSSFNYEF